MGHVMTNNEIRIIDIDEFIKKLLGVIPYCATRKEARNIQKEIIKLEEEKEELELTESKVCPECGGYETEWGEDADDLSCRHEYHEGQEPDYFDKPYSL